MKTWQYTAKSYTEDANKLKEIFLKTMQEEGHITEAQVEKMNKYCFVIAEKSFFGRVWDKILWKTDPEEVNIIVVKVIG